MIKGYQCYKKKQCGPFNIVKKLGAGGFGQVFMATKQGQKYALKISTIKKFIQNQIDVYQQLLKQKQFSGLPKIGGKGKANNHHYFGMQLLGIDLRKMLMQYNRLSMKSVLMIAQQAISRLKFLHGKGFVHRDIKPQNFCIGSIEKKQAHRIYLIDLGLCKKIGDPQDKGGIFGTPSFMSLRAHTGIPHQPADDMQSLFYTLIELYYGKLPWQHMPKQTKAQMQKIRLVKKRCTKWGQQVLPMQFTTALTKIRQQKRQIDYQYYRGLFRKCMNRIDGQYDYDFEWIKKQVIKQNKKIKQQKVKVQKQAKQIQKFFNNYSRYTIEPQVGKGQLNPKMIKLDVKKPKIKLPDPAQFYHKKIIKQQQVPTTSNGPRIAINRQPRNKN